MDSFREGGRGGGGDSFMQSVYDRKNNPFLPKGHFVSLHLTRTEPGTAVNVNGTTARCRSRP